LGLEAGTGDAAHDGCEGVGAADALGWTKEGVGVVGEGYGVAVGAGEGYLGCEGVGERAGDVVAAVRIRWEFRFRFGLEGGCLEGWQR
jgi:hypothetical protein